MSIYRFIFTNDITDDRTIFIKAKNFSEAVQAAKNRRKIDEYILEAEEIVKEGR